MGDNTNNNNNINNNTLDLSNSNIIVTIITNGTINSLKLSNLMGYLRERGCSYSHDDDTYVIKDRSNDKGIVYGYSEYKKIMDEISKLDFNSKNQVYVIDIRK